MRKTAFTFFELLVVIGLLAVFYALLIPKMTWNNKDKKSDVLLHLKKDLFSQFSFEESLKLVCIQEELQCFVIVDGNIKERESYTALFQTAPDVYTYEKDAELMNFANIEFETMQSEEVIFEFNINQDKKSDEMILHSNDVFYVYDNLNHKATVFEDLNSVQEMFDDKINEIKDAF